jgi:hypothetical protein
MWTDETGRYPISVHLSPNVLERTQYVLLYEIFTFDDTPYPSVPQPDMLAHLESGNRLPTPDLFVEEICEMVTI